MALRSLAPNKQAANTSSSSLTASKPRSSSTMSEASTSVGTSRPTSSTRLIGNYPYVSTSVEGGTSTRDGKRPTMANTSQLRQTLGSPIRGMRTVDELNDPHRSTTNSVSYKERTMAAIPHGFATTDTRRPPTSTGGDLNYSYARMHYEAQQQRHRPHERRQPAYRSYDPYPYPPPNVTEEPAGRNVLPPPASLDVSAISYLPENQNHLESQRPAGPTRSSSSSTAADKGKGSHKFEDKLLKTQHPAKFKSSASPRSSLNDYVYGQVDREAVTGTLAARSSDACGAVQTNSTRSTKVKGGTLSDASSMFASVFLSSYADASSMSAMNGKSAAAKKRKTAVAFQQNAKDGANREVEGRRNREGEKEAFRRDNNELYYAHKIDQREPPMRSLTRPQIDMNSSPLPAYPTQNDVEEGIVEDQRRYLPREAPHLTSSYSLDNAASSRGHEFLSESSGSSWSFLTLTASPRELLSLLQGLWDAVAMPAAVRILFTSRHVKPFLELSVGDGGTTNSEGMAPMESDSMRMRGRVDTTALPPAMAMLLDDPIQQQQFHRRQIAQHILVVEHERRLLERIVLAAEARQASMGSLREVVSRYRHWSSQHLRLTNGSGGERGSTAETPAAAYHASGTPHQRSAYASVDMVLKDIHAGLDTYREATSAVVEAVLTYEAFVFGVGDANTQKLVAAEAAADQTRTLTNFTTFHHNSASDLTGYANYYNIVGSGLLARIAKFATTSTIIRRQLQSMTARQQAEWLAKKYLDSGRSDSPSLLNSELTSPQRVRSRPQSSPASSLSPQRPNYSSPTRSSSAKVKREPARDYQLSPERVVPITHENRAPKSLVLREDSRGKEEQRRPPAERKRLAAVSHENATALDLSRLFEKAVQSRAEKERERVALSRGADGRFGKEGGGEGRHQPLLDTESSLPLDTASAARAGGSSTTLHDDFSHLDFDESCATSRVLRRRFYDRKMGTSPPSLFATGRAARRAVDNNKSSNRWFDVPLALIESVRVRMQILAIDAALLDLRRERNDGGEDEDEKRHDEWGRFSSVREGRPNSVVEEKLTQRRKELHDRLQNELTPLSNTDQNERTASSYPPLSSSTSNTASSAAHHHYYSYLCQSILRDLFTDVFINEPALFLLGTTLDWNPLALPGPKWSCWIWRHTTATAAEGNAIEPDGKRSKSSRAKGSSPPNGGKGLAPNSSWSARSLFGAKGRELTRQIISVEAVVGRRSTFFRREALNTTYRQRGRHIDTVSFSLSAGAKTHFTRVGPAIGTSAGGAMVPHVSAGTLTLYCHPRSSPIFRHEFHLACGAGSNTDSKKGGTYSRGAFMSAAEAKRIGALLKAGLVGGREASPDTAMALGTQPTLGPPPTLSSAEALVLNRCSLALDFLRRRVLVAGLVVPLQALVRGVLLRQRMRRRVEAACVIQQFMRGVPIRAKYLRLRGENRVRGALLPALRGLLERYQLGKRRNAIIRVQRVGRGYLYARGLVDHRHYNHVAKPDSFYAATLKGEVTREGRGLPYAKSRGRWLPVPRNDPYSAVMMAFPPSSWYLAVSLPFLSAARRTLGAFLLQCALRARRRRNTGRQWVAVIQRVGRAFLARHKVNERQQRRAVREHKRRITKLMTKCMELEVAGRFAVVEDESRSRDGLIRGSLSERRGIAMRDFANRTRVSHQKQQHTTSAPAGIQPSQTALDEPSELIYRPDTSAYGRRESLQETSSSSSRAIAIGSSASPAVGIQTNAAGALPPQSMRMIVELSDILLKNATLEKEAMVNTALIDTQTRMFNFFTNKILYPQHFLPHCEEEWRRGMWTITEEEAAAMSAIVIEMNTRLQALLLLVISSGNGKASMIRREGAKRSPSPYSRSPKVTPARTATSGLVASPEVSPVRQTRRKPQETEDLKERFKEKIDDKQVDGITTNNHRRGDERTEKPKSEVNKDGTSDENQNDASTAPPSTSMRGVPSISISKLGPMRDAANPSTSTTTREGGLRPRRLTDGVGDAAPPNGVSNKRQTAKFAGEIGAADTLRPKLPMLSGAVPSPPSTAGGRFSTAADHFSAHHHGNSQFAAARMPVGNSSGTVFGVNVPVIGGGGGGLQLVLPPRTPVGTPRRIHNKSDQHSTTNYAPSSHLHEGSRGRLDSNDDSRRQALQINNMGVEDSAATAIGAAATINNSVVTCISPYEVLREQERLRVEREYASLPSMVIKAIEPHVRRLQRIGRAFIGDGKFDHWPRDRAPWDHRLGRWHLRLLYRHDVLPRRAIVAEQERSFLVHIVEPFARQLCLAPDRFVAQREEWLTSMLKGLKRHAQRYEARRKTRLKKLAQFIILRPAIRSFWDQVSGTATNTKPGAGAQQRNDISTDQSRFGKNNKNNDTSTKSKDISIAEAPLKGFQLTLRTMGRERAGADPLARVSTSALAVFSSPDAAVAREATIFIQRVGRQFLLRKRWLWTRRRYITDVEGQERVMLREMCGRMGIFLAYRESIATLIRSVTAGLKERRVSRLGIVLHRTIAAGIIRAAFRKMIADAMNNVVAVSGIEDEEEKREVESVQVPNDVEDPLTMSKRRGSETADSVLFAAYDELERHRLTLSNNNSFHQPTQDKERRAKGGQRMVMGKDKNVNWQPIPQQQQQKSPGNKTDLSKAAVRTTAVKGAVTLSASEQNRKVKAVGGGGRRIPERSAMVSIGSSSSHHSYPGIKEAALYQNKEEEELLRRHVPLGRRSVEDQKSAAFGDGRWVSMTRSTDTYAEDDEEEGEGERAHVPRKERAGGALNLAKSQQVAQVQQQTEKKSPLAYVEEDSPQRVYRPAPQQKSLMGKVQRQGRGQESKRLILQCPPSEGSAQSADSFVCKANENVSEKESRVARYSTGAMHGLVDDDEESGAPPPHVQSTAKNSVDSTSAGVPPAAPPNPPLLPSSSLPLRSSPALPPPTTTTADAYSRYGHPPPVLAKDSYSFSSPSPPASSSLIAAPQQQAARKEEEKINGPSSLHFPLDNTTTIVSIVKIQRRFRRFRVKRLAAERRSELITETREREAAQVLQRWWASRVAEIRTRAEEEDERNETKTKEGGKYEVAVRAKENASVKDYHAAAVKIQTRVRAFFAKVRAAKLRVVHAYTVEDQLKSEAAALIAARWLESRARAELRRREDEEQRRNNAPQQRESSPTTDPSRYMYPKERPVSEALPPFPQGRGNSTKTLLIFDGPPQPQLSRSSPPSIQRPPTAGRTRGSQQQQPWPSSDVTYSDSDEDLIGAADAVGGDGKDDDDDDIVIVGKGGLHQQKENQKSNAGIGPLSHVRVASASIQGGVPVCDEHSRSESDEDRNDDDDKEEEEDGGDEARTVTRIPLHTNKSEVTAFEPFLRAAPTERSSVGSQKTDNIANNASSSNEALDFFSFLTGVAGVRVAPPIPIPRHPSLPAPLLLTEKESKTPNNRASTGSSKMSSPPNAPRVVRFDSEGRAISESVERPSILSAFSPREAEKGANAKNDVFDFLMAPANAKQSAKDKKNGVEDWKTNENDDKYELDLNSILHRPFAGTVVTDADRAKTNGNTTTVSGRGSKAPQRKIDPEAAWEQMIAEAHEQSVVQRRNMDYLLTGGEGDTQKQDTVASNGSRPKERISHAELLDLWSPTSTAERTQGGGTNAQDETLSIENRRHEDTDGKRGGFSPTEKANTETAQKKTSVGGKNQLRKEGLPIDVTGLVDPMSTLLAAKQHYYQHAQHNGGGLAVAIPSYQGPSPPAYQAASINGISATPTSAVITNGKVAAPNTGYFSATTQNTSAESVYFAPPAEVPLTARPAHPPQTPQPTDIFGALFPSSVTSDAQLAPSSRSSSVASATSGRFVRSQHQGQSSRSNSPSLPFGEENGANQPARPAPLSARPPSVPPLPLGGANAVGMAIGKKQHAAAPTALTPSNFMSAARDHRANRQPFRSEEEETFLIPSPVQHQPHYPTAPPSLASSSNTSLILPPDGDRLPLSKVKEGPTIARPPTPKAVVVASVSVAVPNYSSARESELVGRVGSTSDEYRQTVLMDPVKKKWSAADPVMPMYVSGVVAKSGGLAMSSYNRNNALYGDHTHVDTDRSLFTAARRTMEGNEYDRYDERPEEGMTTIHSSSHAAYETQHGRVGSTATGTASRVSTHAHGASVFSAAAARESLPIPHYTDNKDTVYPGTLASASSAIKPPQRSVSAAFLAEGVSAFSLSPSRGNREGHEAKRSAAESYRGFSDGSRQGREEGTARFTTASTVGPQPSSYTDKFSTVSLHLPPRDVPFAGVDAASSVYERLRGHLPLENSHHRDQIGVEQQQHNQRSSVVLPSPSARNKDDDVFHAPPRFVNTTSLPGGADTSWYMYNEGRGERGSRGGEILGGAVVEVSPTILAGNTHVPSYTSPSARPSGHRMNSPSVYSASPESDRPVTRPPALTVSDYLSGIHVSNRGVRPASEPLRPDMTIASLHAPPPRATVIPAAPSGVVGGSAKRSLYNATQHASPQETFPPSRLLVPANLTTPSGSVVPGIRVQVPSSDRPVRFPIRKRSASPSRRGASPHSPSTALSYSPDHGNHRIPLNKKPIDRNYLSAHRR